MAVYASVRNFELLNYDDPDYVNNPHVLTGLNPANIGWAFHSTDAANWFPLTWISHMIDRSLFGADSGAQHLVNVGLHVAAALGRARRKRRFLLPDETLGPGGTRKID